ncbi:MAG: zinc ABC transporter substrate-binding protein [Phycisphaerales bacterium]|nr:zinc ABC transporter substrate-binding protein [Phycisphaerales bacterium]
MIGRAVLACIAMGVSALSTSGQPRPAEPLPPLNVVVTIPPLEGLVQPLLPMGSTLTALMPPGKGEHGYEFKPADLAALSKADIVVSIGLGLEPNLDEVLKKTARPDRQEVGFGRVVGLEPAAGGAHDHAEPDHEGHDHEGHAHHGPDQHLWLDPVLCADLVPVLAQAVVKSLESKSGLTELQREELVRAEAVHLVAVTRVDEAWRKRLAPLAGRAIVTHHDAFSRPAERYGLRIAGVVRASHSTEPTPGQVAEVVQAIRKEGVRTIFIEPQFDPKAAKRIATAAGVEIGTLDPLGGGDWFKLMETNLAALERGLRDPEPAKPAPSASTQDDRKP